MSTANYGSKSGEKKNLLKNTAHAYQGFMEGRNRFEIPGNDDTIIHAYEKHGKDSWQYKALCFLHETKVECFFLSLIVFDIVLVFAELFIEAQYPECILIKREGISCCPIVAGDGERENLRRFLGEEETNVCGNGFMPYEESSVGCGEKPEFIESCENMIDIITYMIFIAFATELNAEMLASGFDLMANFFFALDYFVIHFSFVFALYVSYLKSGDDAGNMKIFSLMVLGRVWRFVRLGQGIVEARQQVTEKEAEESETQMDELRELLEKNGIMIPEHLQEKKED